MRFPSLAVLAERAHAGLRRFPWTLAAGAAAAAFAITASAASGRAEDTWVRAAFVAALGIPATIALTLLGEARGWPRLARLLAPAAALALLGLFYLAWPGIHQKHDAIRFFQLAAVLHLAVAFLPFLGTRESPAFWQYDRRLFLGFLRAAVFSGVLFVGIAIALGALDHLFGVDVKGDTYVRIWFVVAFVGNTWIFLAAVPESLAALERDRDYPRALQVFAQYILTPLAFGYLAILLAYLVKLVAGAEWPSGWIGWLVTSVAVTGLLGFLLVHPLRSDPAEGWIRTYTRWLFIGLIPAAVMLLVAFWKRVVPYGLTEPRVLGIALGLWLLGIAIYYTLRPNAGIRVIPVSLAVLLLVTLYGPVSLTHISVVSQRHRFAEMLAGASVSRHDAREASAALRFLVEHRAGREIARVTGRALPPVAWDSLRIWSYADSVSRRIMTSTGATYVPAYAAERSDGSFHLAIESAPATEVAGFAWLIRVASHDTAARVAGADTVRTAFDSATGIARIRAGRDTFAFDVAALARRALTDSLALRATAPADSLTADTTVGGRRARLRLEQVSGMRAGEGVRVTGWSGVVLVGGTVSITEH